MFYPQGSLYPQNSFTAQSFNPQAQGFPPQGFNPQTSFNPLAGPVYTPFANMLYGFPQQSSIQSQYPGQPQQYAGQPQQYPSQPQYANWHHPAQLQAALQQQALQQLIAHQLAAQQPPGLQNLSNGIVGQSANGMVGQSAGAWPQQSSLGQINPALQQQQHQLQQLAQYHYLIAQQFAQLAAHQTFQGFGIPGQIPGQFPGQFVGGQLGSTYGAAGTMH